MRCRSRSVSPYHCRIVIRDEVAEVRDLKSEGGTFLNGIRIKRCRLADGDLLQVGRYKFFVAVEQDAPAELAVDAGGGEQESNRDTVEMSNATSDTVVGEPPVDDLVNDLLTEADDEARQYRLEYPAARYFRPEAPAAVPNALDEEAQESPEVENPKEESVARKKRRREPPGKLPPPPEITATDSVNAAEQALDEIIRPAKQRKGR